jgi:hypothetical protein
MTSKGIITSAEETVIAAGKSAAQGAKALAGEVANAAAAATAKAKAATTAAAGVVDARKPTSGAKKKVAKRVVAKKRPAPKKKANKKKHPAWLLKRNEFKRGRRADGCHVSPKDNNALSATNRSSGQHFCFGMAPIDRAICWVLGQKRDF